MSGGPIFADAGTFLIHVVFGVYTFMVMLRFLLQTVRADFYNPLVQALVTITNPPLRSLRRFIPGVLGVDMAAIVLMLLLKGCEHALAGGLSGASFGLGATVVWAAADLLGLAITILFWAVIIRVVLSWIGPNPHHPAVSLVRDVTDPLMEPARRLLPPISGLDLSPILVVVGLLLVEMIVVRWLYMVAAQLA